MRYPAAGTFVESAKQVQRLGLVDFVAPCALASALAEHTADRSQGTIVPMGSAAAFHALPFAAAYANAKAGLGRFPDALRTSLAERGARITLVSPGFVDTADGSRVPGPGPFLMQPDAVAARIARVVEKGRPHLVLPWPFACLRWFDQLLPRSVRDRLLRALTPPAG